MDNTGLNWKRWEEEKARDELNEFVVALDQWSERLRVDAMALEVELTTLPWWRLLRWSSITASSSTIDHQLKCAGVARMTAMCLVNSIFGQTRPGLIKRIKTLDVSYEGGYMPMAVFPWDVTAHLYAAVNYLEGNYVAGNQLVGATY